MNRAQANHLLTRWKIYETYKHELNEFELADYQKILEMLEALDDDQLNYVYVKYHAMARVVPRRKVPQRAELITILRLYRNQLPTTAEVMAALGLDHQGYTTMQHSVLDTILTIKAAE